MRAREPDAEGYVDRGGVKLPYEVFGGGEPTLLLMPTWTIVHARFWKAQVPYLARHFRVVSYDGPGNGRSDRPERVLGSVFIGPSLDIAPGHQGLDQPFEEPYTSTEGWAKYNRPVLVIHGAEDQISHLRRAERLAEATGGALTVMEGAGHIPMARDPVKVNLLIREFVESLGGPAR